jgi:hypothetical protein
VSKVISMRGFSIPVFPLIFSLINSPMFIYMHILMSPMGIPMGTAIRMGGSILH